MDTIAYIHTDFREKFGIPRQCGIVPCRGKITLVPPYDDPRALRGLEQFSHIWVIWGFSGITDGKEEQKEWSPTVRPPRLGGNRRMGVFATRSPFRPNHMGLSCLEIERVEPTDEDGPSVYVKGADMMDKTPVYDIKPYVPYADCRPEARGGFAHTRPRTLEVVYAAEIPPGMTSGKKEEITAILSQDPRPSYKDDPERIYGLSYGIYEIKFRGTKEKIEVISIMKGKENGKERA